jgi:hypothetical protein
LWFVVAYVLLAAQLAMAVASLWFELDQNFGVLAANILFGVLSMAALVIAFCTPIRAG